MPEQLIKARERISKIALVVPFFNEEEVLPAVRDRVEKLCSMLPCRSEVVCVNDGSKDGTSCLLTEWAEANPQIKVVSFARNFGHQIAVTAGLDFADRQADAVIIMDGDLQDPPEVVLEMITKFMEGYDIVYGQRIERQGETLFKRATAFIFYRMMRRAIHPDLPVDTGDFRLMSRRSLDAFLKMRERHRFLRGMVTWIGFSQTAVQFTRPARQAGVTKYSLRKMLSLSWNAIVSFSPLPLRFCFFLGISMFIFGLVYAAYSVFHKFVLKDTVPGWTAQVVLESIIGGSTLLGLGVVGEYIAKIFEEIKRRPLYVVQEVYNIDPEVARANPPD